MGACGNSMRVHLSFLKHILSVLALLLLCGNQFVGANKTPGFDSTPSTSSPGWKDLADGRTLPPGVTFLPPDWNDDAKVSIPELGVIQGGVNITFPLMTSTTRRFFFFAGIPYAEYSSYTTANRFKPSKLWTGKLPVDDTTGAFLATDFMVKCPQYGDSKHARDLSEILFSGDATQIHKGEQSARMEIQEQTEECLVINVHTPRLPACPTCELMPVIVFTHGGSFDSMWSGLYRGHRFLKMGNDVLFVSLNYRLGLLGSLNLGIDDAPGNAALYDIVTALKWIKRHIGYFGGDKSKITLSGHSAGAVLATHFLTSDLAIDDEDGEPLIHGIIGLSGSSLSQSLATCTDPLTHHLRVSKFAGCYDEINDPPNFQEIRDCMAQMSLPQLLEANKKYTASEVLEGRFGLDAKLPSIQDDSKLTIPLFMKESPYTVLQQGRQLNIPVMMGVTRHDGSYLVDQVLEQFWRPHNYTNDPLFLRNHLLPTMLDALNLKDDSGELIHSLQKMYIGDAINTDDFESKIPGLIDIYSVLAFKAGAYNLVELHSKKNPSSYYFSFEHLGLCSAAAGSQAIPKGVGHLDSLLYLFPTYKCLLILPNDLSVSNLFLDYWINFATHGNPNGRGPKTIAAPYNPYNHAYLIIDGSDRTSYYCRDAWINNSLELIHESPTPTFSTSTSTLPTETDTTSSEEVSQTDSTTDQVTSTTAGDNSSSATRFYLNLVLIIQLIGYALLKNSNIFL